MYETGKRFRFTLFGKSHGPCVGGVLEGVPAGTPWEKVPDTWVCPECGAGKDQFSKQ